MRRQVSTQTVSHKSVLTVEALFTVSGFLHPSLNAMTKVKYGGVCGFVSELKWRSPRTPHSKQIDCSNIEVVSQLGNEPVKLDAAALESVHK